MKKLLIKILSSLPLRISLLSLLLFLYLDVFSQDPNRVLLTDYIKLIELEMDVRFSFANETVEGIYLTPPSDDYNLQTLVAELSQQTGLRFTILSERFISISRLKAKAGMICGFIYDAEDKLPIEIVSVILGQKYVLSDSSGYFEIEQSIDLHSLHFQRSGYINQEMVFSSDSSGNCIEVFLTPEVVQLDEVTVFKLLTQGINREPGGNIELNVADLGLLPGLTEPDVLQSIQALPGIQSINETISDINIRGGTNDQNLVLWDGIKMYQTGHFFGLISAFNPYLNNTVEIIKNGSSSIYGDGVSGIIDIKSDDKLVSGLHGGAGLNMINADAYLKIPITKKITLQVAGRRSVTDFLKTPMFNNYFERVFRNTDVTRYSTTSTDTTLNSNENFYFYDLSANLLVDINKDNRLKFNFTHFFNDLQYEEDINLSGNDDSKTSSLRQQSIAGSLQYRRSWNQQLISNLQLSLSSYRLNGVNFDIPNNQRVIQENEVLDLSLRIDTRWLLNTQWDFLFGYELTETGVGNLEEVNNPEFFRFIKEVVLANALFAEANYSPAPGTSLRFGTRGNYLPKFNKIIIEPRIAVSQRLGKSFSIELLGELKHQTETQVIDLQNDFLGVENRRWLLANETDVPIVRSKQISTALIYQMPKLLISLEGYYKYVSGITSSSQAFQNQYQYIRTTGDYQIYGSEFLINWKSEVLSAWSSYAISSNQYNFPTFDPSEFPNNLDIRHTINAGVTLNINAIEVSAGTHWHSGKPYTEATGVENGSIIYGPPNESLLPDYFRMDLSIRYNFNLTKQLLGQIGGSLWNITNKKNVFNIYYQADSNDEIFKIEQEALGITPNLSLRVSF